MLCQRPIIMIAKTGTFPRYMAIAAPDRMECVPISCVQMRSLSSPIATTPSSSADSTSLLVMCESFPRVRVAETGVDGDESGYDRILVTIFAYWVTGQSTTSFVLHWVIVSFLRAFFWVTKMMATRSAVGRTTVLSCLIST